jgi:hypothetical protein
MFARLMSRQTSCCPGTGHAGRRQLGHSRESLTLDTHAHVLVDDTPRPLDEAKALAAMADTDGRLFLHSLRHSCLSALATGGLALTTLAEVAGHSDAGLRSSATRGTAATRPQSWRTCSPGPAARGSVARLDSGGR